jgi:hypothetical protein
LCASHPVMLCTHGKVRHPLQKAGSRDRHENLHTAQVLLPMSPTKRKTSGAAQCTCLSTATGTWTVKVGLQQHALAVFWKSTERLACSSMWLDNSWPAQGCTARCCDQPVVMRIRIHVWLGCCDQPVIMRSMRAHTSRQGETCSRTEHDSNIWDMNAGCNNHSAAYVPRR